MRVFVAALVLLGAGLFAATPVFEPVPAAHACSCPGCDIVRDTEVIVSGRITGWRETERATQFSQSFVPVEVSLRVDSVFKGSAPAEVVMLDVASLQRGTHQPTWSGASGACGAFDEDPTGRYIVIGFGDAPAHPWQSNRMHVLFLGDEPGGEQYDRALVELTLRLGEPLPPAAGDSPPAEQATASDDWMFLSAIGAGTVLITLLLLLGGPKREARDETRPGSGRADPLD